MGENDGGYQKRLNEVKKIIGITGHSVHEIFKAKTSDQVRALVNEIHKKYRETFVNFKKEKDALNEKVKELEKQYTKKIKKIVEEEL